MARICALTGENLCTLVYHLHLSKQMNVLPDQIELFLFYYNLYYKFSDTE